MPKAKDVPVMKATAAEVKARRAVIDINQEELAHRAGLHRSFISKLEMAVTEPSLSTVILLAEALEVGAGELVDGIATRRRKEMRRRPRQ